MSKLDANLLTIAPDTVNPVSLVQKALRMHSAELQGAAIEASLVVDRSLKDLAIGEVVVDSGRLLQVLINLLVSHVSDIRRFNSNTRRPMPSSSQRIEIVERSRSQSVYRPKDQYQMFME